MPNSLSVSIVSFDPDLDLLSRALASLARAVDFAQANGRLGSCVVTVLDNGPEERFSSRLDELVDAAFAAAREVRAEVIHTGKNLGYGAANNIAIRASGANYHLILNPDVVLSEDAIERGLRFLDERQDVALVTPCAVGSDGERQYLCKRYPSLWTFFLRGLAPASLRRHFDRTLGEYEMREETRDRDYVGQFLASGCFMLVRRNALHAAGGFDPGYFMYFEDYDLSLRLARHGLLAFVPEVKIVHHGGNAAAKGRRHRAWFLRSAARFFNAHGWRFV
jgi:GT2 family glycosyltransferase